MPRSRTCAFCGREFPPGFGLLYVRNDGSILWYCSGKCRKSSLQMRRDSRKLKWTTYYGRKEKGRG